MTQKINEAMVKALLDNLSREDAIQRIAEALTNRDKLIAKK